MSVVKSKSYSYGSHKVSVAMSVVISKSYSYGGHKVSVAMSCKCELSTEQHCELPLFVASTHLKFRVSFSLR